MPHFGIALLQYDEVDQKMSKKAVARKTAYRAIGISPGQLAFCALSGVCLLLILCHSDTAISYMGQGLLLCAKTVIPSLFPFMVLSELLVSGGCGELLGKLCERPFRRLFGLSGAAACAMMMGLVCGFPVGTKTAVALCRRGDITTEELSRLICFCNIPSSAFLINAVGVSLFGSRRFGVMLYAICLFSALICALLWHRLSPLKASGGTVHAELPAFGVQTFTRAVTSAALSMIYICAYVVFFSALIGTLGHILAHFSIGQPAIAILFGFFELSGGVLQASSVAGATTAHLITAILCGWSGVSVHLQILSLCDDLPGNGSIRVFPYIFSKLSQAALCAILFALLSLILPNNFFAPAQSVVTIAVPEAFFNQIMSILNVSFVFALFVAVIATIRRKIQHRP